MAGNVLKILSLFILGLLAGLFLSQIFFQYRLEQGPVYLSEIKEITIQENTALKKAIERVEKVVVGVRTKTKAGKVLEGSGLIITSDGLMVTLADLVPYGSDFSFFVGNKLVPFQVLKRDSKENLALVEIKDTNLAVAAFADFKNLKLGERVFLAGLIFEATSTEKMINEGIVKSFNGDFIKTNIFEEKNLQGSPLFNIEGEVLGLNTIDKEGQVLTIPISKIRKFTGL